MSIEELYSECTLDDYSDVEPLSIETGLKDEICQIMYSDEYKQCMGLARALLVKNELSIRGLKLTARIIDIAPAFYTIWNYRFNIFVHLFNENNDSPYDKSKLFHEELNWLDSITLNNPKNYQIWSYRQSLFTNIRPTFTDKVSIDLKTELPIINMMIDDDTKNYHVWSYRKWIVTLLNDFSNELSFVNSLIDRDIYNNSAWNHRMFYLKQLSKSVDSNEFSTIIDEELKYTMQKIELIPHNISSWNYFRGIYKIFKHNQFDQPLIEFCLKFINNLKLSDTHLLTDSNIILPEIESSYALEFIAFIYSQSMNTKILSNNAYKSLAIKYDPIRKQFWEHKIGLLDN